MNERQKLLNERWRQTREMGKMKYVAYFGVLAYGLIFFLFSLMMDVFFGEGITSAIIFEKAMIAVIGGIFFGLITWWINERRYQKYNQGH
ncbi:hypothetical protein [Halobacillus campisalis]|uniref:Uncharacterized protein n=1 Tax=Halobacillus campisalis TaxID=435909 RepID=A0ABW2K7J1_9BACI|nr:hypothetical protein [Halobacillus campisalis]